MRSPDQPVIELRHVGLRYADAHVLREVDLSLEEGELVVVAGRTGVGKSSLLGVITGLVPRFTGGELAGDVLIDGRSVLHQPPRERAHLVGFVSQDPLAGFVADTVEEELAYGMEQLGIAPATMRRRVEETLDLLGIADLRARELRTLSGGQQQRVAIGAVLTTHPRVLVLDEPTSALDPTAAEDVLATLTRLVHDLGMTVLLAEHRLERVVPFADRICLVAGDGTIRVDTPQRVLTDSPVAPPLVELGRLLDWDPLPLSVRDARRAARALPDLPLPAAQGPVEGARPRLLARGLTLAHGQHVAVREVDLTLSAGRVTVLMGRNGSGKSSLIWALQGTGRRRSGTVRVDGGKDPVDPADLAPAKRRTRVGLVPQTAADLLYLETVAAECAAADVGAHARPGTCRGLLDRLAPGVEELTHPRDLSEGQRLALALAVVLTARPPVVLLDEPTRGLDYAGKAELARIVGDLAEGGHAVLLATHDVEFAAHVADEVVVMAEGEVVSRGGPRQVLAESPAFAPQVTKVLGPGWMRVDEVATALGVARTEPGR